MRRSRQHVEAARGGVRAPTADSHRIDKRRNAPSLLQDRMADDPVRDRDLARSPPRRPRTADRPRPRPGRRPALAGRSRAVDASIHSLDGALVQAERRPGLRWAGPARRSPETAAMDRQEVEGCTLSASERRPASSSGCSARAFLARRRRRSLEQLRQPGLEAVVRRLVEARVAELVGQVALRRLEAAVARAGSVADAAAQRLRRPDSGVADRRPAASGCPTRRTSAERGVDGRDGGVRLRRQRHVGRRPGRG